MSNEHYWLVKGKTEQKSGPKIPFDDKPVAEIAALTPSAEQPDWATLTRGTRNLLGGDSFSFEIEPLNVGKRSLDDEPSIPKWDGDNLKLWVLATAKDV